MVLYLLMVASILASDAPRTVHFIGYIDEVAVDRFEDELAAGDVRTVVLRSPGGRDLQAIRAANLILDHRLDVRVEEYCISACAAFLLPAGAKRTIDPGSIVSWHLTAASACLVLECLSTEESDRRRLLEFLEPSLALYARAGVDPRIFADQIITHDALCYLSRERDGRTEYRIRVEYEHWVPSARYLHAIGLDFEGDWPTFDNVGPRFERHFAIIPPHYRGGEIEYFDDVAPGKIGPCET